MQIVKTSDNGQGKPVTWFSTNDRELDLISGMAHTTLLHLPRTMECLQTRDTLRNFIKIIHKAKICQ